MTYKRLFWGILLMIFGLLLLLKNLDIVYFNWSMIWHMWPLIFILWGISLLPIKDLLKVVISLVAIGVGLGLVSTHDYNYSWRIWDNDWEVHIDRDYDKDYDDDEDYQTYSDQELTVDWDDAIDEAVLRLDAAAGSFDVEGTTSSNLLEFKKHGNIGYYEVDTYDSNDKKVVAIALEKSGKRIKDVRNSVEITLNDKPVWDVDIDAGAAEVDLDLSNYKVKSVTLDNGAADVNLRLGDLFDLTRVDINSGVSDITIEIPKDAGCHLKTSTFLTGKKLPGFSKQGDGTYVTSNFDDSKQKVYIEVSAAISNVKIKRY